MSWPLYMDHHVPWAVTSGLRRLGFNVLTAADDHAAQRDDDDLLDRATHAGRILVRRIGAFSRWPLRTATKGELSSASSIVHSNN